MQYKENMKSRGILGHKIHRNLISILLLWLFLPASTLNANWVYHSGKPEGVYPGKYWQKIETPEQIGWSSEKLQLVREYSKKIGSSAVMIVYDGVVVDAWGDIRKDFHCHSMRKSLLSSLIGIHVEEGHIDLNKTMAQINIDDYKPLLTAEEKQATVKDLLKARSGIYHPALGESVFMKILRPKRGSHKPGTFWFYNNWDFNALGTIFEQETGTGIFEEFNRRIANPLQMEDFEVNLCKYATSADYGEERLSMHRYYRFRMSARDLARFGLLFLREGQWQNLKIISSDWIRESTANHSERGRDGGYGYMWWTGSNYGLFPNVRLRGHSYYAAGYGGHRIIILPYKKLVIVHRVNTDIESKYPQNHHIGRFLWLILSAAGEMDIGKEPYIEASNISKLTEEGLKQLLKEGARWVGPNIGIFPLGKFLELSIAKDGTFSLYATKNKQIDGKWWISGDRFYYEFHGEKSYFYIVQEGNTINLFDETGTLFGSFQKS